jgi:hypothetical protein
MKAKYCVIRFTICLLLSGFVLASCSANNTESKSTKEVNSGIKFSSNGKDELKTETALSDLETSSLINSQEGVGKFSYLISPIFVNNATYDNKLVEKYISSERKTDLLQSVLLKGDSSSINNAFMQLAYSVESYSKSEAIISVIGLNINSGQVSVTSKYQEIRLTLAFNKNWKVVDYSIANIVGPTGDASQLSAELIEVLKSYIIPPSLFNQSEQKILVKPKTLEEIESGTTTTIFYGE